MAPDSDSATQLGVQGLDGVRGVDDFTHSLGKREKRDDAIPVPAPGLGDGGVFLAPEFGFEGLERGHSGLGVLPKKGERSVGVAPQYASALGKNANCQTLVSLTLASGEVPVMVGLRLFLPENWTSDPAKLTRAGVPEERTVYRTKPEIALAEIDRVRAAGLRFGCVLADAGYGLSAPFRQGSSERGLVWAVGIPFK